MKPVVILSGQKWFGVQTLLLLKEIGWRIGGVAAPEPDRLRDQAKEFGLPVESPAAIERIIPHNGADLLICADHRDHLPATTRARFGLGVLAFHGSFLPRHRGGSAVEWTIRFRDPIAGASIYWMDDGMDTGPIAATGLKLFRQVFADIEAGNIVKLPQEREEFAATWEPALKSKALAPEVDRG